MSNVHLYLSPSGTLFSVYGQLVLVLPILCKLHKLKVVLYALASLHFPRHSCLSCVHFSSVIRMKNWEDAAVAGGSRIGTLTNPLHRRFSSAADPSISVEPGFFSTSVGPMPGFLTVISGPVDLKFSTQIRNSELQHKVWCDPVLRIRPHR